MKKEERNTLSVEKRFLSERYGDKGGACYAVVLNRGTSQSLVLSIKETEKYAWLFIENLFYLNGSSFDVRFLTEQTVPADEWVKGMKAAGHLK